MQTYNMSDDDPNLFSSSMADVKPLKHGERIKPSKPRPKPRPQFSSSEPQSPPQGTFAAPEFNNIETGDSLSWHRPGLQKSVLRKLRRGFYTIKDELDLHGLNQQQAKCAVADFLNDAGMHQYNCVRIIHGKGYRSEHGPVLKRAIGGWLVKRPDVLAFSSAPANDGGTGAIYILLKQLA